jgi:hypothetical protein
MVTYRYGTVPSAGTLNGCTILKIRSGLPMVQPSAKCSGPGRSALLPSGAPASTHAAIVSICACDKLGSFLNVPIEGSAPHGGISRFDVRCLMARAHGLASS